MRGALDFKNTTFYLDMTSDALRDLVKTNRIPYKKRGDKLIFLVRDLDAWLQALPGPNAADMKTGHLHPATFADTQHSDTPKTTPEDTTPVPPIKLARGPRQHVSADSAREQSR